MDSLLADYNSSSDSSEDEREEEQIPTTKKIVTPVTTNAASKPVSKETPKPKTIDINIFSDPFSKAKTDNNDDDDDDEEEDDDAKALRARDAANKRDISRISSFSDLLPPPKNPSGTLQSTKRKMMIPVKFRKSAAGPRPTTWDNSVETDPKRAKILEDCAFALANAPVPDFGDEVENANETAAKTENSAYTKKSVFDNNDGTLWDYSRPAQRSTSNYVYSTSDAGMREKELERVEHSTEETALDLSSDYLRSLRTEEEEMLQNNPAFVQTIKAPTFHLGFQSRRKHQLKYLAVDAYYKEQSLAIKRANGKKSKAETQSKYGW